MTTIRTILKLLTGSISVFLLIFFISCNGNDGCDNYPKGGKKYIEFHAEDSLKIPYTGTDTLTFLHTIDSTVKDTVVFIGQGKKYGVEYIRDEGEMTPCEYELYARKFEIAYMALNKLNLQFNLVYIAGEGNADHIYIYLGGLEFFYSFWRWDWTNGYYEYITFNNKTYRKVQKSIDTYNSINNRIYYNFEYGIIRIELDYLNEKYQLID